MTISDITNRRARDFVLFYLASGGRKPKWAAAQAGYSGDLGKRARSLLEQPAIREVLERYAPPVNKYEVKADKRSIIRRLEQIASAEGIDKSTANQLKAIEYLMRNQGMLDGTDHSGKERLSEIVDAFKAGPVAKDSVQCACKKMNGPTAKFCSECGALIERPASPADVLAATKKKFKVKEAIQYSTESNIIANTQGSHFRVSILRIV
jgi:hypothetical protein